MMITKASEALARIRPAIEIGEHSHICVALDFAENQKLISSAAAYHAKARIRALLGPHGTYRQWITVHHRDLIKRLREPRIQRQLVQGRLAWIDGMIKWHEARGD